MWNHHSLTTCEIVSFKVFGSLNNDDNGNKKVAKNEFTSFQTYSRLFGSALFVKWRLIFFKGPFWGAYFWRGLYSEGLIYGGKLAFQNRLGNFTVFALFYYVFEGNFPSTSPRGAYIWRGDLTEGFLRCELGGLIFGGASKWRGLFSAFYGNFLIHSFFLIRMLFFRPRLNILILLPILGRKYSSIILSL